MKTLAKIFYIGQIIFTICLMLNFGFQAVRGIFIGTDPIIVMLLFCIVGVGYYLYGFSVKEYQEHLKRNKK